MLLSELSIAQEIKKYIDGWGGQYSAWYVGIAEDVRERLFSGHDVNETSDQWIFRNAPTTAMARKIERYFVESLGTDGGPGGGDEGTKTVYAYKKNFRTRP